MAYVPLFCRSHFSPRGVAMPADLVRRARALGYTTLGLCDEATIAGFMPFEEACRANGIRPVFGLRLPVLGLTLHGQPFPIDFLIETEQGYRNLVRALTQAHQGGLGELRPLERDQIDGCTAGLLAVIPPDGELAELLALRERPKTESFLKRVVDLFGAQVAFGLPSPATPEAIEQIQLVNRLATFIRIRVVAAGPVFYPDAGDAAAAVFLDHPVQPPDRVWLPPEDLKSLPALWSEEDVVARWAEHCEEAPHEAGAIARRCTWRPGRIRRAFPTRDLERGFDPNSYLFDLAIRGATQRYGEITEPLKQRINREIEDVKAHNLAPYLLLGHAVAGALDKRGISRGFGRGRLVSSVLAYCLGVTRIDPLQYNLVAKSLMVEGDTYPPLLVEIPRGGVEPLLEYLREGFGADHLAEIGRAQEARRDQLLGDLAQWAGMTDDERRLAKRRKNRLRSAGAAQRLGDLTQGQRQRRWRDPQFLADLAARLAPRPRLWLGSGDRWVLGGEPLDGIVPIVRAHQGRPVTGLGEDAIDRLGLARVYFVPHNLLDILDQTLRSARAHHPNLDFTDIPLDDRAAFDLLGRGDTAGIPPLESILVRALLRRESPRNLLQLLRIKTEAAGGDGAQVELGEELPDVLLSYKCAFLKANYPLAFHAAAIGAAIDARQNPIALVREARRAGFAVHPPDINLSDWGATIHGGAIRLGLGVIRGLGGKAWEQIHAVRSGGPFTSLESFCERIDMRIVNLRMLRALIAAGAMDALDAGRAAMDQAVVRLQRRVREREQEEARREVQATLFDLDPWSEPEQEEAATVGEVEEWNPWERRRRESEALGFYLSVDPIERFKIVLEHLKPLPVERLSPRRVGRQLRVAGLVCGAEPGTPIKGHENDMLLDLEGLPVWIPRTLAEISSYCLELGTELLAIGQLGRSDGFLALNAVGVWRLADIEDQATRVAAIRLNLAEENRETLKLLFALAREFPGSCKLEIADFPGRKGFLYRRLARLQLFFCSPLYQGLCKILPPESVELFGPEGEPLLVRAPGVAELDEEDGDEEETPPPARRARSRPQRPQPAFFADESPEPDVPSPIPDSRPRE